MFQMREIIANLRKETETTLRAFYALRQFRQMLARQDHVEKINENVEFWKIFESSLRTSMFLGIRRLYEAKSDTFNFQKFIKACIDNTASFSKEALRHRKCEESPNAEEWVDGYIENVDEPDVDDFRSLAKLVRQNSKKMKGVYTEAATKRYAHAIHVDRPSIAAISDKLNFEEIEQALTSIWHTYEQVWEMFENGRHPVLEIGSYPHVQEVIDAVSTQVLGNET